MNFERIGLYVFRVKSKTCGRFRSKQRGSLPDEPVDSSRRDGTGAPGATAGEWNAAGPLRVTGAGPAVMFAYPRGEQADGRGTGRAAAGGDPVRRCRWLFAAHGGRGRGKNPRRSEGTPA